MAVKELQGRWKLLPRAIPFVKFILSSEMLHVGDTEAPRSTLSFGISWGALSRSLACWPVAPPNLQR